MLQVVNSFADDAEKEREWYPHKISNLFVLKGKKKKQDPFRVLRFSHRYTPGKLL